MLPTIEFQRALKWGASFLLVIVLGLLGLAFWAGMASADEVPAGSDRLAVLPPVSARQLVEESLFPASCRLVDRAGGVGFSSLCDCFRWCEEGEERR